MISPRTDHYNQYSCQILLPGFGITAQRRLKRSKVLIVGLGGLGCPVAQYLAAAGIGTITIADNDIISVSNLHRQTLFAGSDVGHNKARVGAKKLQQQYPNIQICGLPVQVTADNAPSLIGSVDTVVDCSDNFATRYLLNDVCVTAGKPLVYGAAYRYEGHVAVWNAPLAGGVRSANYRDIFADSTGNQILDCNDGGVLPTLTGIIGCMQANEVIKYLTGLSELLTNRLMIVDALSLRSHIIQIPQPNNRATTRRKPTGPSRVPTISASDLKQQLKSGHYQLIDVRDPEAHESFDIGGYNIPLTELLDNRCNLDLSRPTVIYCQYGIKSDAAVRHILANNKQAQVLSLNGGLTNW